MKTCYFLCVALLVFVFTSSVSSSHHSYEGLSIFAFDGLVLKSLSINTFAYENNSIAMSLSSQFDANGSDPVTEIRFIYGGDTAPASMGKANVIIDVVYYYAPSGGRNFEWGTYFKKLFVDPQTFSNEVLYRIDLREEVISVLSFFSSKVSNLTVDDIGFLGRFSVQSTFANSTNIVGNKNHIRYLLTCDGDMTTVTPDFTIPDEADLIDATWGAEEMVRIIPTRVQTSFSVSPSQRISKEVYVSWKMPEDIPPPEWHEQIPWKWVWPQGLYFLLGLIVARVDSIYRFFKRRMKGKPSTEVPTSLE